MINKLLNTRKIQNIIEGQVNKNKILYLIEKIINENLSPY